MFCRARANVRSLANRFSFSVLTNTCAARLPGAATPVCSRVVSFMFLSSTLHQMNQWCLAQRVHRAAQGTAVLLVTIALLAIPHSAANAQSGGLTGLFPFLGPKKPAPTQRHIRVRRNSLRHARPVIRYGRDGSRRIYVPYRQSSRRRSSLPGSQSEAPASVRPRTRSRMGGYKTFCVRTCDGFYWPMSHGVSSRKFRSDRYRCEASCTSETRLFITSSSADNIATMRDLNGKPYKSLKQAFAYRKAKDPICQCKPKPWSRLARLRHNGFAPPKREKTVRLARTDLPRAITNPAAVITAPRPHHPRSNSAATDRRIATGSEPIYRSVAKSPRTAPPETQGLLTSFPSYTASVIPSDDGVAPPTAWQKTAGLQQTPKQERTSRKRQRYAPNDPTAYERFLQQQQRMRHLRQARAQQLNGGAQFHGTQSTRSAASGSQVGTTRARRKWRRNWHETR